MKYILRLLVVLMMGSASAQSNLPPCDPSSIFHNCFGTYTFSNGDKYVGEYKDNRENGQGTFTGANGDKYVGEWKDGKRNGQGTLTFARGEKYVGKFKDGIREGEGTLYSEHGLIISQGRWYFNRFYPSPPVQQAIAPNQEKMVNTDSQSTPTQNASNSPACQGDLKSSWHNCLGNYKNPNGTIVNCEIKNGRCDGKGTALFPNGSKYVGDFKDGVFNGHGTYSHAGGDVYVGEYKDDKRNGQGTYTFTDGVKYVGGWKDGNRNGQGILYASNGSVNRQGEWYEGKFVVPKTTQQDIEMLNRVLNLFSGTGGGSSVTNPQELAKIKQQNLAHRWVVQAQAVCPSGWQCSIKEVKFTGNNESDGSSNFQIAYESRRGSGGSSGVEFIECGFNKSNSLNSTSVNAVCQ